MRMKMRDYGWKWSSPHRLTAVLQINPRNLEGKTSFIADTLEQRFIRTAVTPAGKRFLSAVSWGGRVSGWGFTGCLSRWLSKGLWQCWSISQCVHTGGGGGSYIRGGPISTTHPPPAPTLQPPGEQERKGKSHPLPILSQGNPLPSLSVCSWPPTSPRSPHYFPIKTAAHPPNHPRTSSWYTLQLKRFFLVRLFYICCFFGFFFFTKV